MKGIILAGGSGTRLYPTTKVISKQLIPVYDKPMIYYSFSTLMLAGIREVLLITTEKDLPAYQELFGDGSWLGMDISYCVQSEPRGVAEAFILGEKFIGNDSVCLVLGDNLLCGNQVTEMLQTGTKIEKGALIYGYYVNDPKEFGVIEFDENKKVISIEEKPQDPKSNYAIPGIYFYDNQVVTYAKNLQPSSRGELEISDLNQQYLAAGDLQVELLGRGIAWLDTGTCEGLLEATSFIYTIQKRTGLYLACLEEIAYKQGYITREELLDLAQPLCKTDYGRYLLTVAQDEF
ncbi:glucose-1-phosphate thymidylyltransferase RfbA [Ligilactobacillus ceti]|uniref:Glucose-1-phosphate thymidylyltransferase n=1 Tax=Ligilactobacillus ceti DSM 22408 TaxID=1122146 RepID=A0A0R2KG53_9LACO|nr:glucose-1-phosphate thymidylyltransferase RfbA [Ligilactobacillus ceti]KRN88376.1 glucose-1-phosphate thymidylyltransferase [Ligilactobacillus ceti DSM 22408]